MWEQFIDDWENSRAGNEGGRSATAMKVIYRLMCIMSLIGGLAFARQGGTAQTVWFCTMALIFYDCQKE